MNCPICVEEIKSLNNLVDEYRDNKNGVFIGIATNKSVWRRIKRLIWKFFPNKYPFKYNIVPSVTQTILMFGKPDKNDEFNIPFPLRVVIDREGKTVVKISGIKGVETVRAKLKRQCKPAAKKTE